MLQLNFVHTMAANYLDGDGMPTIEDSSPIWLGRMLVLIIGGLIGDKLGFAPRIKSKMA